MICAFIISDNMSWSIYAKYLLFLSLKSLIGVKTYPSFPNVLPRHCYSYKFLDRKKKLSTKNG